MTTDFSGRGHRCSAVLAVIIPPSILMIVWGGLLTVSIGGLFLAGIIPGVMIALAQMATVHAVREGAATRPIRGRRSSRRSRLSASRSRR